MTGARARAFGEPLETLFGAGTCAGLSDGQLLARFVAGRDESGELAFETLVKRHGPMVSPAHGPMASLTSRWNSSRSFKWFEG